MTFDCNVFVAPTGGDRLWRLNEKHCEQFLLRSKVEHGWQGSVPYHWGFWVTGHTNRALPRKALTYTELQEVVSPKNWLQDAEVFLAIMAWAGMNPTFGRSAWQHIQSYTKIVADLRSGMTSPTEAYAEFSDAISNLEKPGIGPAHFTKLIHFCAQGAHAYVMDQRTAASINLLFEPTHGSKKPVLFNGVRISSRNSSQDYTQFCRLIDLLAELIGDADGVTIARRLSSTANRRGGTSDAWWQYVIEQGGYTPPKQSRRTSLRANAPTADSH